jgi:hypothetical protein
VLDGLPHSLADLAAASDQASLCSALGAADREIAAALKAWPEARAVGEAAARALSAVRKAVPLAPDAIRHRLEHKATLLSRVMFEAHVACGGRGGQRQALLEGSVDGEALRERSRLARL